MEGYDPMLAQRVWQRVLGQSPAPIRSEPATPPRKNRCPRCRPQPHPGPNRRPHPRRTKMPNTR